MRIELTTAGLQDQCSATEPSRRQSNQTDLMKPFLRFNVTFIRIFLSSRYGFRYGFGSCYERSLKMNVIGAPYQRY